MLLESPSSLIDRLLEPNEDDPVSSDLRSGTLCLTSDGCCPAAEGEDVGELGSAEKVTRGSLMLQTKGQTAKPSFYFMLEKRNDFYADRQMTY